MRTRVLSCCMFGLITLLSAVSPAGAEPGDELGKINPVPGTTNEYFGRVATNGSVIVVGAVNNNEDGTNAGAFYIYDAATRAQLFKVFPPFGEGGGHFGGSVAIDGTTAIIGEDQYDRFQTLTGAAHLYDVSTGQRLHTLTANDGDYEDFFGTSVDIHGNRAVVGAAFNDDVGQESGSVYVFDVSSGQQTAKILPVDGVDFGTFGAQVSIWNNTVLIGTPSRRENGPNSGVAYLYDATTGQELAKIIPADNEAFDAFGSSVEIRGNLAAIGAQFDQVSNIKTGSVYLYDISDPTSPVLLRKFVPEDQTPDTSFGWRIAMTDSVVCVGAYRDHLNGIADAGSAYLFDLHTGDQITKMTSSDGDTNGNLGSRVALAGSIAVIGAQRQDQTGAVYIFDATWVPDIDTDGDGLRDGWETDGIPWTDSNGLTQRLILPGANPNRKDLYIEVDSMDGFGLNPPAELALTTAFANAPLQNPDNTTGVTLHLAIDEDDLPHVSPWLTNDCWPNDFDFWRSQFFGPEGDRGTADSQALLEARAKAYRYCIIADLSQGPNKAAAGCGAIIGDNFVVFSGSGSSDLDDAAIFMHELGHNLGLRHGGGDDTNGKPNYPSIMNYVLSYKYDWNAGFWELDYSRAEAGTFPVLHESDLNELAGVGTPGGHYKDYMMPFGVEGFDVSGGPLRDAAYLRLDGSATDFGDAAGSMFQDGVFDSSVSQDLNFALDAPSEIALPSSPSFAEDLLPFDDWGNVILAPVAASGETGAAAPVYPTDELTAEAVAWINANFPPPPSPCPPDLNGDGLLDNGDIQVFITRFLEGSMIADLNGDGILDNGDIARFIEVFLEGC